MKLIGDARVSTVSWLLRLGLGAILKLDVARFYQLSQVRRLSMHTIWFQHSCLQLGTVVKHSFARSTVTSASSTYQEVKELTTPKAVKDFLCSWMQVGILLAVKRTFR